jgi:hypothetical protein
MPASRATFSHFDDHCNESEVARSGKVLKAAGAGIYQFVIPAAGRDDDNKGISWDN